MRFSPFSGDLVPVSDPLEAALQALGDSFDQLVFLKEEIHHFLSAGLSDDLSDLLHTIREAQHLVGADHSALNAEGRWQVPVPHWIENAPPPERIVFTLAGAEDHCLAVPFSEGWLVFWGKVQPFTSGDASLAEMVATLVGTALLARHAQRKLMEHQLSLRERNLASRIWQQLVPTQVRCIEPYRLDLVFEPAEDVGGDFYLSVGNWLAVGDISGKGLPAALFTAMFMASLPIAFQHPSGISAMEVSLHELLERSEMFATLALLHIDAQGQFQLLNYGHPPILHLRQGSIVGEYRAVAPPLGTFRLDQMILQHGQFEPGDVMCLYTDGLIEAQDAEGELYQITRLKENLSKSKTLWDAKNTIVESLASYRVTDDFTLMLLEYRPPQTYTVPFPMEGLEDLADFVRTQCSEGNQLETVCLAIHEFVLNAARHGGAQFIRLEVFEHEKTYALRVTDNGSPFDIRTKKPYPPGELREGGYGILIIKKALPKVDYRQTDQGHNETTFEIQKGSL